MKRGDGPFILSVTNIRKIGLANKGIHLSLLSVCESERCCCCCCCSCQSTVFMQAEKKNMQTTIECVVLATRSYCVDERSECALCWFPQIERLSFIVQRAQSTTTIAHRPAYLKTIRRGSSASLSGSFGRLAAIYPLRKTLVAFIKRLVSFHFPFRPTGPVSITNEVVFLLTITTPRFAVIINTSMQRREKHKKQKKNKSCSVSHGLRPNLSRFVLWNVSTHSVQQPFCSSRQRPVFSLFVLNDSMPPSNWKMPRRSHQI